MSAVSGDRAKVSVFVRVRPAEAFVIFTEEIDAWWRTGPQYRIAGKRRGELFFEAKLGGRLFETFELSKGSLSKGSLSKGSRTIEVGRVVAWEPPSRLELEWRGVNYAPGELTWVEVVFHAQGEGTLVTVCHRGFSALRDDHPVRHGRVGADFSRWIGMWWGGLMTSLREHAEARARSVGP